MKISILLFILLSCNSTPKQEKEVKISDPNNCMCIEVFQPVCFKGKTYSNGCHAQCAGAKDSEIVMGECAN